MEAQGKSASHGTRRAGHGEEKARDASRRWVPIAVVVISFIALASTLYSLNRPSIPDEIEGLIEYGDIPSIVVDGQVAYSTDPPAGGQHAAKSLECGLYFNPVANERGVAALATGAIWVAFDPSISETDYEDLAVFGEGEADIFMAPYPDLPHPYVITAWGVQLYPDSPTDPRIASFVRDFKNADSAPYPDAPCDAGASVEGSGVGSRESGVGSRATIVPVGAHRVRPV